MKILFISSFAVISADAPANRRLYLESLGLPLQPHPADPNYLFSESLDGCKHFGIWPLAQAAQACFNSSTWPKDKPVPQFCLEFELADTEAVAAAARELEQKGHMLIHGARKEPWGQTVARLLTSEGGILGISFAPWMHQPRA